MAFNTHMATAKTRLAINTENTPICGAAKEHTATVITFSTREIAEFRSGILALPIACNTPFVIVDSAEKITVMEPAKSSCPDSVPLDGNSTFVIGNASTAKPTAAGIHKNIVSWIPSLIFSFASLYSFLINLVAISGIIAEEVALESASGILISVM